MLHPARSARTARAFTKHRNKELLAAANLSLFIVYLLRDPVKELWGYRHTVYAARAWNNWYRKALRSRIEALRRFAGNLSPYLPSMLPDCRGPLSTNLIESINNKLKVIKRMAYGFCDDAYFFLKSGPPSPESGEEPQKTRSLVRCPLGNAPARSLCRSK